MLKYRELFPNATVSEYSYKKAPMYEKVIRCIRLKRSDDKENPSEEELEKKTTEGKETFFI